MRPKKYRRKSTSNERTYVPRHVSEKRKAQREVLLKCKSGLYVVLVRVNYIVGDKRERERIHENERERY